MVVGGINRRKVLRIVSSLIALLCVFVFARAWNSGQTLAPSEPGYKSPENSEVVVHAHVTAYTSSADECGNDLGITSSGEPARDGIVACNFLPFGTRIKIPAMFGDKEFVVKDRMAKSKRNFVDVWVHSKRKAFRIGKSYNAVVIVS